MELPDFTQIPLKKDALFALDDLQASSGYGRHLILPDDVPPVLSVPQIQGTIKPRLVTGQDDGSVNVHVTNPSSGGGGTMPTNTQSNFNGAVQLQQTNPLIVGVGQVTVVGFSATAVASLWSANFANPYMICGFSFTGRHSGIEFDLCNLSVTSPVSAISGAPTQDSCIVWFPAPLRLAAIFPSGEPIDLMGVGAGQGVLTAATAFTLWQA